MRCYEYTECHGDYDGSIYVGMAENPEHFFKLLYEDLTKDWTESEGEKPKPNFDISKLEEISLGRFSYSSWGAG